MAAKFQITIYQPGLEHLLKGRTGPTVKDMERRARNVMAELRRTAPGSMKRKITSVTLEGGRVEIRCSHPATVYVVQGTRPHEIWPHPRPRAHLKFKGRTGKTVYAKMVHHPGTRPNNFMMRAVRRYAAR